MTRYFLQIRDQHTVYEDHEGIDAAGIEQLWAEIERTVRAIVEDEGGSTESDPRLVEVVDEAGALVLAVAFASPALH